MNVSVLNSAVIDINSENFNLEVIDRSYSTPVVVDFWAEWCGPCRTLSPILERLVEEFQGKFILAKVDVDANQALAMQYQVQGIPAVKAFVEGNVVGEFTGAQPEPQVRDFIQKLIPSLADMYARQGYEWEMSDQLAMAITNYKGALKEDPDHHPAMVGLGRTLMKQDQIEAAIGWLNKIPEGKPEWRIAQALVHTAQLNQYAAGHKRADLEAKIEENPNDLDSRLALASLLAVEQRLEAALQAFLEIIQRNKNYEDGLARQAMLAIFTTIGDDHPTTKKYQQLMARALF